MLSLTALLFVSLGSVSLAEPTRAEADLPPLQSPQSSHDPLAPGVPASSHVRGGGEVFQATCNYMETTGSTQRSRPSLAVGLNDYGSIGIHDPGGGVGFQMPIGAAYENLAIGEWIEGWRIHASTGSSWSAAYHYPETGPSGPITRIDDFYLESLRYITYRVTVDVGLSLLVDFEWTLDKERCDLTLRTTIENQSPGDRNVHYKRVVDWDNLGHADAPPGSPNVWHNRWSEDGRTARAYRTLGFVYGSDVYECSTSTLGSYLPDLIDLYAWDDYRFFGTGPRDYSGSYNGDGNAGFHFYRYLEAGGTWTTFLRYTCEVVSIADPVESVPVPNIDDRIPRYGTVTVERAERGSSGGDRP